MNTETALSSDEQNRKITIKELSRSTLIKNLCSKIKQIDNISDCMRDYVSDILGEANSGRPKLINCDNIIELIDEIPNLEEKELGLKYVSDIQFFNNILAENEIIDLKVFDSKSNFQIVLQSQYIELLRRIQKVTLGGTELSKIMYISDNITFSFPLLISLIKKVKPHGLNKYSFIKLLDFVKRKLVKNDKVQIQQEALGKDLFNTLKHGLVDDDLVSNHIIPSLDILEIDTIPNMLESFCNKDPQYYAKLKNDYGKRKDIDGNK